MERGVCGWLQRHRGCVLCCQIALPREGGISRLVTLSLAKKLIELILPGQALPCTQPPASRLGR